MEPTPEQSPHHAYPDHWEADVVLRDGGTARIRPITTDDAERLVSFYEQVSDESKYYRFFAPYPRLSDRDVHRFTHHDYVDRVGLAVTIGGEFIGTVRYDRINDQGRPASAPADEAEVAFLVQDAHQGRGVASALLEHIAAVARERGIRRFAAEVLPANNKMIKVFRDGGYTQRRSFEDGSVHLTLDLEPTEKSLAVQRGREQRAEARSVQRLLAPGSVAVIGTGRTPGGVGRTVLRNLLASGYTGRTYAVNRAFDEGTATLDGVPAHRSLGEIDEQVDLAVIAVPAHRVPEAVADCGEHGVQGLVVLSAGYAERGAEGRELQRELVRQARSYGMRIIGPNAFGIINTAESVRLNASLAPESPARGRIGLFTQSGAIGIALLSGLHRRGAGLSSFISAGNRADVSGNDFLQYSFEDPDTDVALLYLESLGNPRKFNRLARRTAAVKPVVVVKGARHSGSTPPGHAVPVSRIPDATVSALMRQAGVIRVDTVTEMVDAGLLLAGQPLPAGPRVAILGNSESLGLLTYDACLAEGLRPRPPIDLTTAASPQDFRDALAEALADGTCDAVIVTAIPWVGENGEAETGDGQVLATALHKAVAGGSAKPVAVVHVEIGGLAEALAAASSTAAPRPRTVTPAAERPRADTTLSTGTAPATPAAPEAGRAQEAPATPPVSPGPASPADPKASSAPEAATGPGRIPAYPAAERAVRALAEAVKYAQWRRQAAVPGKIPEFLDDTIDEPGAAALIEAQLATAPDPRGRPLTHDEARELLGRYGIAVRPTLPAPDPDAAVAAATRLGYPVALKTTAPHLRHRADLGGVRLDIADEEALRRAYGELTDLLGKPAELLPVVQAMAPRGVDTVVRASIDAAAGAVLSFGLAGAPSELLGDTAHRLVPATDRDAAELIRSIRAAPVLFGWRGSAPVDTAALEELLLRLSRLVDDHPEVVSVALEPVVVAPHGLTVLGASVRLAPPPARSDLGPRRLPNY
ncbi:MULTISPECIES: bifunctional GNAT family N-acetyltransferase/acetate--CoA ligase family protein [unclassified Streptomyces]|uniref:bifunctional acetate--CoA ligase family protein/GNAT family N-acetyltransferase n=1 Tax=unclassified Streptomyces TaxID=2593676 RepID=UPI001B3998C2|nr:MULTISPECIES: bifunctional GNAT family N-acetyltransferase/acetate--CoA ligase family protein [unclassified Streptomyces]MBQ1104397.1 GNAT family N-acetyltransferase [Streptomyces sp. 404i]MDX3490303.1 GNAT family N-acetyltransferase [Streptomyces sp. ID05-18]